MKRAGEAFRYSETETETESAAPGRDRASIKAQEQKSGSAQKADLERRVLDLRER